MGNFLARNSPMVHPSKPHQLSQVLNDRTGSRGTLRVKVRMTARELKELLAEADPAGKGDGEIGQLILRECLRGNCHARVIGEVKNDRDHGKVRSLHTITEEEN